MSGKRDAPRRARRDVEPLVGGLGLEAEFVCIVDGHACDPGEVFGDPRAFLDDGAFHRTGTSYHLPTGGAVYFDTGVIEVVSPVIELAPGAPERAVRSLWEGVCGVRERLDLWSRREGRDARLAGFSAHYNVSLPTLGDPARIAAICHTLVHLLPFAVMLFAANRRSTGVGVRPRPDRVEVTVDFTPDPALMTAAAAIALAAVAEVAAWDRVDLREMTRRGYPLVNGFQPVPHTSRNGWLARYSCFDPDPFRSDPGARLWRTTAGETLSVRGLARRAVLRLAPRLRAIATPGTLRLVERILTRRSRSLLDLRDRPPSYEDVGRLCVWREPDPRRPLARSAYEQVMRDAMAGRPIEADGRTYRPVGTVGWTRVRFRSEEGDERSFTVQELARLTAGRRD